VNARAIETGLARFTLGALLIYAPVETYVSIPYGLLSPNYLVDFIAMILLGWGALHSLRARPYASPGILCAGFAWCAANGWRATAWRWRELKQGGALEYGTAEIASVAGSTALALVCLVLTLYLVMHAAPKKS
jgi:hypothetical protein